LAKEALDHDRRVGELRGENLDRQLFSDADVLRLVHGRHAAAPQLAGDLVLAHEQSTDPDLVLRLYGGHFLVPPPRTGCLPGANVWGAACLATKTYAVSAPGQSPTV